MVLPARSKHLRQLVERVLFVTADLSATDAEEASFFGRFRHFRCDGRQPRLVRSGLAGDFFSTAPTAVLSVPINASFAFAGSPVGTSGSSGRPPPVFTLSARDLTISGASPRAESAIALPTAMASFAIPIRPLVSDRATNIPAATGAPEIAFHLRAVVVLR